MFSFSQYGYNPKSKFVNTVIYINNFSFFWNKGASPNILKRGSTSHAVRLDFVPKRGFKMLIVKMQYIIINFTIYTWLKNEILYLA